MCTFEYRNLKLLNLLVPYLNCIVESVILSSMQLNYHSFILLFSTKTSDIIVSRNRREELGMQSKER